MVTESGKETLNVNQRNNSAHLRTLLVHLSRSLSSKKTANWGNVTRMPNGVKALGARYENILRDLRGGLTWLSGVIEYEGFASLMGESRIPGVFGLSTNHSQTRTNYDLVNYVFPPLWMFAYWYHKQTASRWCMFCFPNSRNAPSWILL